jgi:8-oxo-dGTP diphosphatase
MRHSASKALTFLRYRELVAAHGAPGMAWHALGEVPDEGIGFAVHLAAWGGRPLLVRNHARSCWELPGGRREPGETILATARRELVEETGALDFDLEPIGLYSVQLPGSTTTGLLCRSRIRRLGALDPAFEIAETRAPGRLDLPLCYPEIQGRLLAAYARLFPGLAAPAASWLSSLPDDPVLGEPPFAHPFEP